MNIIHFQWFLALKILVTVFNTNMVQMVRKEKHEMNQFVPPRIKHFFLFFVERLSFFLYSSFFFIHNFLIFRDRLFWQISAQEKKTLFFYPSSC